MSLGHKVQQLVLDNDEGLTGTAVHWERVRLGDIAAVVNGFPFISRYFNNTHGTPVLRIRDILHARTGTFYSGPKEEAPTVEAGDLVVGMDGNFNCRTWSGSDALLNQRVCKVHCVEDRYSDRLLGYVLPGYLKLINNHTSAVTVKHLSSRDIEDIPLPLPPRAEQERLVSKIEELFSSIDEGERALKRARKLVERYRQSVLKAAVTGELTREWRKQQTDESESGEALLARILEVRRKAWESAEIAKATAKGKRHDIGPWRESYKEPAYCSHDGLPELPNGWVWARAEQLCGPITKGTTPSSDEMTPDEGQVPFVKVYNLTFRSTLDFTLQPTFISKMVHETKLGRSVVLPGDVLMNIVGPPLGKVSIVPQAYPEWNINQAVAVFRPLPGLDGSFLALYLLSRAAQDWYSTKAKATVGQINLTLEICRDTPIPLPPLAEQAELAQLIEVENSRLDDLEASLNKNEHYSIALRQSVLRSAFSGALVPQDNSEEPASVLLGRIASEFADAASGAFVAKETKGKRRIPSGMTTRAAATRKATTRKGKA